MTMPLHDPGCDALVVLACGCISVWRSVDLVVRRLLVDDYPIVVCGMKRYHGSQLAVNVVILDLA